METKATPINKAGNELVFARLLCRRKTLTFKHCGQAPGLLLRVPQLVQWPSSSFFEFLLPLAHAPSGSQDKF